MEQKVNFTKLISRINKLIITKNVDVVCTQQHMSRRFIKFFSCSFLKNNVVGSTSAHG